MDLRVIDPSPDRSYGQLMASEDIESIRRRTEAAYARWRACVVSRQRSTDEHCNPLKADLDVAAQALFAARRPSIAGRDVLPRRTLIQDD